MYKLPAILLLFFNIPVFSQLTVNVKMLNRTAPARSDTVYYDPAKKLTWDKFKGKAAAGSNTAAVTTSGFGYGASIEYDEEQGQLDITVMCYFSKKSSWVKAGRKTSYILNHEQKHFDITYIWACNFLSKLGTVKFTTQNFNAEIKKVYKECYDSMQQMQDEYDEETQNGQLKAKQTYWNNRITEMISAL